MMEALTAFIAPVIAEFEAERLDGWSVDVFRVDRWAAFRKGGKGLAIEFNVSKDGPIWYVDDATGTHKGATLAAALETARAAGWSDGAKAGGGA